MGVDYDELEELELDREEQTEWWEVNGHNLAPDERKGLVRMASERQQVSLPRSDYRTLLGQPR